MPRPPRYSGSSSRGGFNLGDFLRTYLGSQVEVNPEYEEALAFRNDPSKFTELDAAKTQQLSAKGVGKPFKAKNWFSKSKAAELNNQFALTNFMGEAEAERAIKLAKGMLPIDQQRLINASSVKMGEEKALADQMTQELAKRGFNTTLSATGLDPLDMDVVRRYREMTPEPILTRIVAENLAKGNEATKVGTMAKYEADIARDYEPEIKNALKNKLLAESVQSQLNLADLPALHKAGVESALHQPDVVKANLFRNRFQGFPQSTMVVDTSTGNQIFQVPRATSGLENVWNEIKGQTNTATGLPSLQPTSNNKQYIRLPDGTLIDPITKKKYILSP